MSNKCEYPNCRCPFDMGPDNLCLIGKPNPDTRSRAPVPKGWKLVPIEPTTEMRDAAQAAFEQGMMITYQQMYRAMINAAPAQRQNAVPEHLRETLHNLAQGLDTLKRNANDAYDRNFIAAMLKDVDGLLTTSSVKEEAHHEG